MKMTESVFGSMPTAVTQVNGAMTSEKERSMLNARFIIISIPHARQMHWPPRPSFPTSSKMIIPEMDGSKSSITMLERTSGQQTFHKKELRSFARIPGLDRVARVRV